jgi:hypothetical protein
MNVANLIKKSLPKVVKILKVHLIFMNFEMKNFIVRNDSKKETLIFECYNRVDSME